MNASSYAANEAATQLQRGLYGASGFCGGRDTRETALVPDGAGRARSDHGDASRTLEERGRVDRVGEHGAIVERETARVEERRQTQLRQQPAVRILQTIDVVVYIQCRIKVMGATDAAALGPFKKYAHGHGRENEKSLVYFDRNFSGWYNFGKIIKTVAIRCHILKRKCTKCDFGWEPARGAYSAPPDPLPGFKGGYF